MGIIRFLLALSVVCNHLQFSPLAFGTAGQVSVQAFFLISGFYISMALGTSYGNQAGRFWLNRALRLYPAYLIVAAASLAFNLITSSGLVSAYASLPRPAAWLLALSNVLVFGQDWVMFAGVQQHALHVVASYTDSSPQLWTLLLVPPAWSLGVELTFYLIAPFILRLATRWLAAIAVVSVLLRVVLFMLGLHLDPWSYRFFPTELVLFVVGAISFRSVAWWRDALPAVRIYGLAAVGCVAVFIVMFPFVPGPWWMKNPLLYACLAICLPVIFERFRRNRVDRLIGDLSYPLYISHWLTLAIMRDLQGEPKRLTSALLVMSATVLVAVLLNLLVEHPLERLRTKVRGARSVSVADHVTNGIGKLAAD